MSHPLVGDDSFANPEVDPNNYFQPSFDGFEQAEYFKAFGLYKALRLEKSEEELVEGEGSPNDQHKHFYKEFFSDVQKDTHFVVYGRSFPTVIMSLLEKNTRLDGIVISYIPNTDTIRSHSAKTASGCPNAEAYKDFEAELFKIVKFVDE